MCVKKKMYQSHNFMTFLKSIGKDDDKHVVLTFFSILHTLIRISKIEDVEVYLDIQTDYKRLLLNAFCDWNERYTYSNGVIKDTLQMLDLSSKEWCRLHWKRVQNAILVGIEDVSKIYENISYIRDHCGPSS